MGFLTAALERRATKDVAITPAANPADNWTFMGGLRDGGTGITVTPELSLQISAMYACIRNISEDVGKLPGILYERTESGKTRAPKHPVYSVMHDMPNPEMTAMDMRSTLQGHLCGRGNGYAYIEWDSRGAIAELWPLRPDYMIPYRDPKTKELMYEYTLASEGTVYHWPKERVFHLHGLGFDGLMGYDPVQMQMRSLGLALATEEFGSRFFGNGARPGIVYKHPGQLSDTAYKHLNDSMEERHTGLERSHRIKILEEGMDVVTIGTPPEEAQFLQTRKFQVTEIARWYRMPPHKIADLERATFSNIEEQSLDYVTDTLMSWLVRWEQAVYRSLLLPRERGKYYYEHLLDSLLRGKTLDRYNAYHLALTDGWMNRNEVRESENRNQVDGLDEYLAQLNMAPAGAGAAKGSDSGSQSADTEKKRSFSADERRELEIWQRKAVKAVTSGGAADIAFEIREIAAETAAGIHARLKGARSADDVNAIFDELRQVEQAPVQVTINLPVQSPPVVNVAVNVPEQSAPVVNVAGAVVNVPEPRMAAVNVEVNPTPVTIENHVNVPSQPTPFVNLEVNPTPVTIENNVSMPGLASATVKRDANGRIIGLEAE